MRIQNTQMVQYNLTTETEYVFTQDEAKLIAKLIGKSSRNSVMELGLSSEEDKRLTTIFSEVRKTIKKDY